jgi:hypothetical protein
VLDLIEIDPHRRPVEGLVRAFRGRFLLVLGITLFFAAVLERPYDVILLSPGKVSCNEDTTFSRSGCRITILLAS